MLLIKKLKKYIFRLQLGQLFKKQVGFTLMELMVGTFIMALLIGVFLVNYHSTNERIKLVMDAQKLASDIRLMQSYTLGLREFDDNGTLKIPPGGWGIHMAHQNPWNDHYILFADLDEDSEYDDPGEEFKTVYFSKGVQIKDKFIIVKSFGAGEKGRDVVDITFEPPDPITHICCAQFDNDGASVELELENTNNNTSKSVEINYFGLVDVLD